MKTWKDVNRELEETEREYDQQLREMGFVTTYEIPVREDEATKTMFGLDQIPRNRFDFKVDENNKKIAFCNYYQKKLVVFDFTELQKCELLEDNKITKQMSIGGTILGAAVGGLAGAVITDQTSKTKKRLSTMYLIVYTNNIRNPMFKYGYKFDDKVSTKAITNRREYYAWFYKVYATIEAIISQN